METYLATAACVFFAAHGSLAGISLFGSIEPKNAPWLYTTNWALAWSFAYLALI